MTDIVLMLKAHARMLHRQIEKGERGALEKARHHKDFCVLRDTEISQQVRRRHCLWIIANELGFQGWPHLLLMMQQNHPQDFGTFFYPKRCRVHWNIWFASYDEAARVREEHGGFLIAYRTQFLVVDDDYVRSFGLDPHDPVFNRIGRDWVRFKSTRDRDELYARVIETILG